MAANGLLIALLEMVMIYNLEGKRKTTYYITIGVFLVGISFLLLNLPGMGPLLAFTMIIVVTMGEILSMPFMNTFWISRSQTDNRGEYAALYTMAWSGAQTLGPAAAAQVAQYYHFNTLWWLIGILSLITSFLFWRLQHARKT